MSSLLLSRRLNELMKGLFSRESARTSIKSTALSISSLVMTTISGPMPPTRALMRFSSLTLS